MSIVKNLFGYTRNGEAVYSFRVINARGAIAEFITYGAAVRALLVPNREGTPVDVCLGYDTVAEYEEGSCFFGAVIGRYANRIAGSRFCLNGVEYTLTANEGENHLHGGCGFDKKVFEYEVLSDNSLRFSYFSRDGEEGYPGDLRVTVDYTFTDENELEIEYKAVGDKDTIVNLTNHAYFNLNGAGSGTVLDHWLWIPARRYLEVDGGCIPTGVVAQVKDTPFDFTSMKPIGRDIDVDHPQLKNGQGYDHNYLVDGEGMRPVAELYSPESGIKMVTLSTKPGLQFYSGNVITQCEAKGGEYGRRSALCLETQYYPDTPNRPEFPTAVLRAGEEYRHSMVYAFSVE